MKKRFMKSFVTFITLFAMLTQNAYGVYAAATSPVSIKVENEFVDDSSSSDIEIETVDSTGDSSSSEGEEVSRSYDSESASEATYSDSSSSEDGYSTARYVEDSSSSDVVIDSSSSDVIVDSSSSDVIIDSSSSDTYMDASSSSSSDTTLVDGQTTSLVDGEVVVTEEAVEENIPEELEILETQISGSGLDELEIYIDTEKLEIGDSFRILFTGPDSARYAERINDILDTTAQGYYRFVDLEKEGFNIRATSDDNVKFEFTSDNGTPVIKVISIESDADKLLFTKTIEDRNGNLITAIKGEGHKSVVLNINSEELAESGEYTLYVDTEASVEINGEATSSIVGTKSLEKIELSNLNKKSFTAYIVSNTEAEIAIEASITDEIEGIASFTVKSVATKVVYEYEDANVYVRAVLQKADAIPDDAVFSVSPVTFNTEKYLDAMNENADEENKYTEENTLFYDIAFYTDETKTEEIEPEEGSVNITVEFKKNQLEEEIGVEENEAVEVAHIVEEGNSVAAEILEADISSDNTEVNFETESFSVFGFANIYGTTAKVKITAPVDGKYYVALGKGYSIEHNKYYTEKGTLFASTITEVNVSNGEGTANLVVTNEIKKEGLTINDVNVLLLEPNKNEINVYDQNSYKVICKDGTYKYSYFVNYEYDELTKTQNISINEPSGSAISSRDITSGLGKVTDFVVLADKFDQAGHFEGNIAVNHFGYKSNFEKGGAKQTQLEITIKKKVESTDAKDKIGTFYFGVYDIDGNKIGDTVSITTNAEGYGETKVTIDNAISAYKVYELNVNGVKLESGSVNDGFEVSYVYSSDTTDGTIASYDGINFTKHIYGSSVLGETLPSEGNLVLTLSGAQLITCSENIYREKREEGAIIAPVTSEKFDELIKINDMLGNVSSVSSRLANAKSSDSVKVYYISAEELASGSLNLPDNEGKYIVLNVFADKDTSVISYGLSDSQFKIGDKVMKDSSSYYRPDDDSQLSKITYWNFIYSDGTPFKGTVIDNVGNGNMNGFMLAPSGRFETSGVTGPTSIFAKEVKQGGGEIHKNSQPKDIKRYATAEVTNRKQGTNTPGEYEFKVQKLFGDWKDQSTWTEEWSGDNDVYGFVIERYYPELEENPKQNFLVSDKFPMPNGSNPEFGKEDKNEKVYVYLDKNNKVASFGSVTFDPVLPGEGGWAPDGLVQDVYHPGYKKADGTIVKSDANGKISYRCVMYKITELSKKGSEDSYKNGNYIDTTDKVSYSNNTVLDATRTKIIKLWVNTYVRPDGTLSVGIEGIDGIEDKVMDPSNPKSTERDGSYYCYNNNREPIVFRNYKREEKGGLEIRKTFNFPTNMSLEDKAAAKRAISFTIDGPDGYTDKTITLANFTETPANSGVFVYTENPVVLGEYKVTETNSFSNTRYSCETTYAVGANGTAVTGSEATVAVAANATGMVSFVNTYNDLYGSLKVKKSLFGLSNKILTENEMKQITFTVTGPNNYSKSFTYNDVYSGNKGVAGEYVLDDLVIGGEYVVTETNALFGKGYTCTTNYRVNSSTSTTGSAATITAASGVTTVEFENTYSYKAVGYLRINAIKSMSGDVVLNDYNGKFSFEFTSDNDPKLSSRGLGNAVVTNHTGGKYITFDTLEYTDADLHYDSTLGKNVGQYTYTLKEIKPANEADRLPNIVYDESVYTFVVDLEDLGNGVIKTVANVYKDGSTTPSYTYENSKIKADENSAPNKSEASEQAESARPVFTNTYVKPNQLVFKTHKSVAGTSACEKSFNFILEETTNVTGQAKKLAAAIRVSAKDTEEVEFTTIAFDKNDIGKTYTFHVYEEKEKDSNNNPITKKDGITYSNAEYTVTVVVGETANHNVDLSNVTITPANIKTDESATNTDNKIVCNFVNDYEVKPVLMPIYGRKNLIGATSDDSLAGYKFKLEAVDANALDSTKCVLPSETEVTSAETTGYFSFGNIEFKEAGEYKFKITEDHEGASLINGVYVLNDVIYSAAEYYVTVNVTPDTAGDLVISDSNISVKNGGGDNAQTVAVAGLRTDSATSNIIFNNQKGTDASVTLLAKKSMSGLSLSEVAEQFEFELVTKNSGTPETYTRQINNTETKKNASDGVITFNAITYKLSDLASENPRTFTYYIHEIKDANKTYYSYDEGYHQVDVTVTYDSANNTITAVPTYVDDIYSAIISNTYSEDGYIDIEGNKTLIGRKITDSDDFAFTLKYTGTDTAANGAVVKYGSATEATFDTATALRVNDIIYSTFKQDTFQWSKGKGTGTFKFDRIFVDKPGNYYFELTETQGTQEGITYNVGNKTYLVTVTATKDASTPGRLNLSAEYSYGSASDSVPSFINEITTEGFKNLYAIKTISNGSSPDNVFKFVLSRDLAGTDIVDGPVTNDGSSITFKSETYKPSDLDGIEADENGLVSKTYTYYIREQVVAGLASYYGFSEAVYAATITVTNDADGNFTVGNPVYYEVKNGELTRIDASGVKFENPYYASGCVKLFLEKVLTGRNINENEFSFTLTEENAKTATPYTETVYSTTTNAGEVCTVKFADIIYDENDLSREKSYPQGDNTYARYYVIRENTENMASGVTPDSNLEWHVVVTLKDNGKGTIDTDWYAYQGAFTPEKTLLTSITDTIKSWINVPKSTQHIRFNNTYAANGKVRFTASKKLVFEDTENTYPIANATDYSFVLTEKVGKTEKTIPSTNTLNEDGTISVAFGNADGVIEYTDADKGDHEYVLYEYKAGTPIKNDADEIIGYNNNGVYYDMTEYHIYVNVADVNNNGRLTVTTTTGSETSNNLTGTLDENGVLNITDASFTNRYRVTDDSIVLGGRKSFVGSTDMKTFSFNLVETDASGNVIEGGTSLTVDNKGENTTPGTSFSFAPIEYKYSFDGKVNGREADTDGNYKFYYQISETDGTGAEGMEGIIFDGHTCNVVVTLSIANGVLSHTVEYTDGETALFENYYSDGTSIPLSAKKVVKLGANNKPEAASDPKFIFELTKKDDTTYETQHEYAKNTEIATFATADTYELSDMDKNGSVYIPTTFTYQIRELSAKKDSDKAEYEKLFTATAEKSAAELVEAAYAPYTFSDDIYEIDVLVTPNVTEGTLTPEISEIRKNGVKVTDEAGNNAKALSYVVFNNDYSVEDGFIEIDGRKFVENHTSKTAPSEDSFEFILLDSDKNEITSTNPTDGVFKFTGNPEATDKVSELQFTYEDISTTPYVFYVKESVPEVGSRNQYVHYDETLYKVEVTVSDAGDGSLDIQKKIYIDGETNEATKPTGVVTDTWFTNEFFDGTQVDFDASKTISTKGVTIPNDFEFTLTQISGKEITSIKNSTAWEKKSGKYVQTVYNNGANIDFEPIEFKPDEVGEYDFEIRETEIKKYGKIGDGEDSNFKKADENAYYVVHVNVEFDSATNTIVANKTYKKFETGVSPTEFENLPNDKTERSYVNFVNDYEDHIYVGFGGYKTLLGFDNEEKIYRGKYNFVLSRINDDGTETVIETLPLDTATHEGIRGLLEKLTGQNSPMYFDFEFVKPGSVQEFTQDDIGETFTYVVKELAPETPEKHIQYSKAIYTAKITVGLDSTTNKLKLDSKYTVADQDDTSKYVKGDGKPALVKEEKLTTKRREITFEGFDFTNKCQLDGQWQPVVTKEAKDFVLDKDHSFNFTIAETDETFTNPLAGGYSDAQTNLVTGKDSAAVTFKKDVYEGEADLGNHYYVIKESLDGVEQDETGRYVKNGIVYDAREWHVTVNVTLDPEDSSKLIASTVDYDQVAGIENQASATFTNRYEGQKELTLAVDKILCGRAVDGDAFEFALLEDGKPVKDKDGNDIVASLDGTATNVEVDGKMISGLKYKFGTITYTQDSLKNSPFTYTVTEVKGSSKGIDYSEAVYTVKVTLKVAKDGSLDYDLEYTPNAKATEDNKEYKKAFEAISSASDMKFVNKYTANGAWDPEGYKELVGRDIKDEKFTFKIAEVDQAGNVINGHEDTVVNNGNQIKFSSDTVKGKKGDYFLKYTEADLVGYPKGRTYLYEVSEVTQDTKNGISCDKTTYTITVKVTDKDHNGILSVDVNRDNVLPSVTQKIKEANLESKVNSGMLFAFVNEYSAEGSIDLLGTKVFDGPEAMANEFKFSIKETTPGVNSPAVEVANNNGLISFASDNEQLKDMLTYKFVPSEGINEKGEHTYEIREVIPADKLPGVTYDETVYTVKVNVVDDNEGHLKPYVTDVTTMLNGGAGDPYPFFAGSDQNRANYFAFTNKYEAKAELLFKGTKHFKMYESTGVEIKGADLVNEDFQFALYKIDTAGRRLVSSAKPDADGNFVLGMVDGEIAKDLKFNQTQVSSTPVHYQIEEVSKAGDGIEYDRTVYDVYATVGDVTAGSDKLNIQVTANDQKGNIIPVTATNSGYTVTAGNFDFTNYKSEYVTIYGEKHWVGASATATLPDVTIKLYASNVGVGQTVINTAVVNASTNYRYSFDSYANGKKLPAYTPDGQKIVYRVDEEAIPGVLSEKREVGKNRFDFYNTMGELLIRKVDSDTGETLEGAVLAILDPSGNEIDRFTTGVSAHAVDMSKVTEGTTYTLREISAPTGYRIAKDQEFTFKKGETTVITMRDDKIIGSVRLRKLDATTRETLEGAEFALYKEDGTRVFASGSAGSYRYSERSSNGVFAVNASGELLVTDLPYGTYYFTELKAPTGYVLSTERFSFSVLEDGATVEVTALNTKELGSVRLRKTNADGTASLAGAVFELYAKTPSSITAALASTLFSDVYYIVGTYRTDASGVIEVSDLPWDDYYFVEVEAPAGYEVNRDVNGDLIAYRFTLGTTGTARVSYDLGRITNSTTTTTPPPEETETPGGGEVRGETRLRREVRGERTPKVDDGRRTGGVLSGVLGVRAAPKQGVLGERLGPVTGDAANIFLWSLLLLASIGAILAVLIANVKRKKQAR